MSVTLFLRVCALLGVRFSLSKWQEVGGIGQEVGSIFLPCSIIILINI